MICIIHQKITSCKTCEQIFLQIEQKCLAGGGQQCYNWDYNIIIKEFKEKPKNNKQKVKKLLRYLGRTLKNERWNMYDEKCLRQIGGNVKYLRSA